jgi:hypothetical protein
LDFIGLISRSLVSVIGKTKVTAERNSLIAEVKALFVPKAEAFALV